MVADYAVQPGLFLKEYLEEGDLSLAKLCEVLDTDIRGVNKLLDGDLELDRDTAETLAKVTETPAESWLALEAFYREEQRRIQGAGICKKLDQPDSAAELILLSDTLQDAGLASYLRKKGAVTSTRRRRADQAREFLDFMGCSTLADFGQVQSKFAEDTRIAALKVGTRYDLDELKVLVWLTIGQKIVDDQLSNLPEFNAARLREILAELKSECRTPSDNLPERVEMILAEAGVAFTMVDSPPKLSLLGMTHWNSSGIPMIQLTGLYQDDGHFVHALFHEIGHILDEPLQNFYDFKGSKQSNSKEEVEANAFANEILFGNRSLDVLNGISTREEIITAADRFGVSPGLIVMHQRRRRVIDYSERSDLIIKIKRQPLVLDRTS